MKTWRSLLLSITIGFLAFTASAQTMRVDVDATELHRHLLHSTIRLPVQAGENAIWLPEWIPGIHGPGEQHRNMAGLEIYTPDEKLLDWKRDPVEMYRFLVDVPAGVSEVLIKLKYIANQPTRTSGGVDSYGNAYVAVINFNTAILYREGMDSTKQSVRLRVKLPEGWKVGTALKRDGEVVDGWHAFAPVDLRTVIDSPLIAGKHFRTLHVKTEGFADVYYHFTSESESALRFEDDVIQAFENLAAEAAVMFGHAPFDAYHFLTVCSDELPSMGLEHLASSLNGVGERGFVDKTERENWPAYLLPHEFVHAWCGKYRRPAGMVKTDYHTDKHTALLWVYEGLTQYLGDVLTVRSGLMSRENYIGRRLPGTISWLSLRSGRNWRTLEDTAVSAHTLRGGTDHWAHLRRNQDYYSEGAMMWMEIDATIRQATNGEKSLDDFCNVFFGPKGDRPSTGPIVPFDVDEIVKTLNNVVKHDWQQLIDARMRMRQQQFSLDFVDRVGYRIVYAAKPSEVAAKYNRSRSRIDAVHSLGLKASTTGSISEIAVGSPADKAGLAEDMQIIGVNDRKFTRQRMEDAIADSTVKREVKLLLLVGDTFRTVVIHYADGPKNLTLVRNDDREDWLGAIISPRAK